MEEGGMTDLQFKSWIRLMIHLLKTVESQDTLEKTREKLAVLLKDLEEDLKG